MKKILLIIFCAIAGLGLVLGIIGFAMGGTLAGVMFNNGRLYYQGEDIGNAPGWLHNVRGIWSFFGWYNKEDLSTEGGESTEKAPFDAAELQGIQVEISAGYLTLRMAENPEEVGLVVRGPLAAKTDFKKGVWNIESKISMENVRTSSEQWSSNPRFYQNGKDITTEYILTLPAEFAELHAELEIGVLKAEGFTVDKAEFSQNLGLMRLSNFTAKKSKLKVDLGAAEITNYKAEDMEMAVNLGGIEFEGEITGVLKATCDLGGINCTLARPGGYGYNINVGLGGVTIDKETFNGAAKAEKKSKESGMRPFYDIECGLGGVTINFKWKNT